ncbi:GNAT family N-acetyltransferase [Candidatus Pacearchaeota archaeon]|nr:GNAT family N-acetyltransferase [Candidatus Pacearchaeota archaeon]
MELETERLVLREYSPNDVNDIILKINDLDVSKYLEVVPYPYTSEDGEWFVNHCVENSKKTPRDKYEMAITLKESGEFIGGVGLSNIDTYVGSAELGYWIGKNYWRQGIMTEAIDALINFAFYKLELNRLILSAYVPNTGSNELAKKLGFTLEGTTRQSARTKSTGKIYDTNCWGLLKQEWRK